MDAPGERIDVAVRSELSRCWQRVLDNVVATGRAASDEFPFLLPDSSIAALDGDEAYAAFTRKRLFLEYAIRAGRQSGRPLEVFTRELDRMVRSLMPLTQRWQQEQQQQTAPTLPVLDPSAPLHEQMAMVLLNGACLFPGEKLPSMAAGSPGRRVILTPGPVAVADDVMRAVSRTAPSAAGPNLEELVAECLDALMPILGTTDAQLFLCTGSAALAREIVAANCAGPGESILVVEQGQAGRQCAEIARALGRRSDVLLASEGGVVDPDQLRTRLAQTHPGALVVSHVDSSTGTAAPVDAYLRAARDVSPETLVAVDAVSAVGGVAQDMDAWGADCVVTVSDQALAGLPGLVVGAFSERVRARTGRPSAGGAYYADLARWLPGDEWMKPSPPLVAALRAALYRVHAEGLTARYARHEELSRLFRQRAEEHRLGVVALPGCEASTVTALRLPASVDARMITDTLADRGVDVGTGRDTSRGPTIVVAHMGETTGGDLEQFWRALEQILPVEGSTA